VATEICIRYKSKCSEMILNGYASMLGWNDVSRLNHQARGVGSKEKQHEYMIRKSCEEIL